MTDWQGRIVFILAVGVTIELIILAVKGAPQTGAVALSTLDGAVIGAVATYIGTRRKDD